MMTKNDNLRSISRLFCIFEIEEVDKDYFVFGFRPVRNKLRAP